MSEPPVPGTMVESLMLLVWKARQDIRALETKALINTVIIAAQEGTDARNKALKESWTDYLDALFPANKHKAKSQDQKAIDYMNQEIKRGPLRVIPLEPLTKAGKRRRGRKAK